MGTRQSESLGDSAASGGGHGDGRGVPYSFSLNAPEVVLAFGESLSSGMIDAGRSGSNLDAYHKQVMRYLRRESQLQLQWLQQRGLLPLDSLCNSHHQADEHGNHRRPTPRPDSPGNQRAVDPPPQQQQQQDQPSLAQLHGFDWGWLARADEQSGSNRFVGTGGSVNRILPPFPPISELGSGAGEGFSAER